MSDYPEVVGVCPACGWHSLFLAEGGFVTCNRVECPDPEAATARLAGREVQPPDRRGPRIAGLSAEQREQPMIPLPAPSALSPGQLRAAADALRRRYRPPSPSMMSSDYLVHQGIRALAQALDEVAAG